MTVDEIKELVLLQLGEDPEDVEEFDTLLDAYMNQAYVLLMDKRKSGMTADVEPLSDDTITALPARVHPAIADYATYRILQNGNTQKQARGQAFYASFEEQKLRMKSERDEAAEAGNSGHWKFTGLWDY